MSIQVRHVKRRVALASATALAMILSSCAGKPVDISAAKQKIESMNGISKQDLILCAGIPFNKHNDSGLELWDYNLGNALETCRPRFAFRSGSDRVIDIKGLVPGNTFCDNFVERCQQRVISQGANGDAPPPSNRAGGVPWDRPWTIAESEEVLKEKPKVTADWMRAHPAFFTDVEFRSKVVKAHEKAVAKGLEPGTDAYFAEVERLVGIKNTRLSTEDAKMLDDANSAYEREDYATAFRLFQHVAEKGNTVAELALGIMYTDGRGVPQDYVEANKWLRQAAAQGDARAQNNLGYAFDHGLGVPQDFSEALRWYSKSADQGEAYAQTNIGSMYENGRGVTQSFSEAAKWYRAAADQGNARGQYSLASLYNDGNGVRQDYTEMVFWLRKAAEQGHAMAQYYLAAAYARGAGVSKNTAEAIKWYRAAAEKGNLPALTSLGRMYADGDGVTQDDAQAVMWFRKSADKGDADAQDNLAFSYQMGRGVQQDYVDAIKWYRKAADQGWIHSLSALGDLYGRGQGVPKNDEEAASWYRKAADKGDARSQYNLGLRYHFGRGVTKDEKQSIAWYLLAANQGHVVAQYNLGVAYAAEDGGSTHNYADATKWWRIAAEKGYARAQSNLGSLYEEGKGVTKDLVEAYKFYRLAADQGQFHAMESLGEMYENGRGVQKDFSAAYFWYSLVESADIDVEWARLDGKIVYDKNIIREIIRSKQSAIALRLTPSELSSVRQRVAEWKPVTRLGGSQNHIVIQVTDKLWTSSQAVDLVGKIVGGGRVASFTVDGSTAPVRDDGTFNFQRTVPIGVSEIAISVRDEWNQKAEARIKVVRETATSGQQFAELNPTHAKTRERPDAIALIIGIDQYKSIPPAEFAENDAKAFYDYATNALGIPASRIRLLTGNDASRLDIQKALRTWAKPLIRRGKTDVFVFFSGHGLASEDGNDLFLLPYDGDRDLLAESAIRRKELVDAALDAGAASATLFLDTCYSGGTRGKETLVASARPLMLVAKDQQVPPNVTILAAAGNDQLSSSLAAVKHGLFSYFLMKGLEGDAAGTDHTITAAKLESYLVDHIPSEAAKLGRTQTPQLVGDGDRVISGW